MLLDLLRSLRRAPGARSEVAADVAIVGGGIVGVIAARLLADSGRQVVLLEAGRFGHGATGRSTAKVTAQHALFLQRIADRHGDEVARHYAEANRAGVELIGQLAGRHGLDCSLEAADSVVYATTQDGAAKLKADHEAAASAGLAMELLPAAEELAFATSGALRLAGQAQFQPAAFVAGLAATLAGSSCQAFENSPVLEWDEHGVRTAKGRVHAKTTIMATHLPLGQVGQFHAHTSPHMHAILVVPVAAERAPAGMYISVDQPKRSFRRHRAAVGRTMMIFTGSTFTHTAMSPASARPSQNWKSLRANSSGGPAAGGVGATRTTRRATACPTSAGRAPQGLPRWWPRGSTPGA